MLVLVGAGSLCLSLPMLNAGAQGDTLARAPTPVIETVASILPQESMQLPADLRQHYGARQDVVVPRWQEGVNGTPRRAPFEFGKAPNTKRKAEYPPDFHFLPQEERGSRAIGRVNHGRLVDPDVLVPEGPHWKILPRQRARGLNYGHNALISLIKDAAADVAKQYPESILGVGNIGRQFGGPIPYSVSHQVGRDADIAFFATDPNGNSVVLPDLLTFTDEGVSQRYRGYYHFDVRRNWALVEAMIRSEAASLQYLFISNGLKKLLMDYAIEAEVSPEIIEQAEILLRQPARYIPHNDHLHVRIYCTPEDLRAGCEDFGARHAWMPAVNTHVRQGVMNAAVYLEDERADVRLAAVMRLGMLKDFAWTKDVAERLNDPAPEVRRAAAVSLLAMAPEHAAAEIHQRLQMESDEQTIVRFLDVLSESAGDDAARAITEWMAADVDGQKQAVVFPEKKGAPLKLYAIDALARSGSLIALPQLHAALTHDDLEIRSRAARAIMMITNHQPTDFNWASPRRSLEACTAEAEVWAAWIDEHTAQYKGRLDMALAGMVEAGYEVSTRNVTLARSLAQAAGDHRPHVRENAQRMLMRMTGKYPPSLTWSPHDAQYYWTRWVRRHEWAISSLR